MVLLFVDSFSSFISEELTYKISPFVILKYFNVERLLFNSCGVVPDLMDSFIELVEIFNTSQFLQKKKKKKKKNLDNIYLFIIIITTNILF